MGSLVLDQLDYQGLLGPEVPEVTLEWAEPEVRMEVQVYLEILVPEELQGSRLHWRTFWDLQENPDQQVVLVQPVLLEILGILDRKAGEATEGRLELRDT